VLSAQAGYPVMGLVLGAGLLLVAAPMTAVALHTGGRPLLPGALRRRGGTPAALVAAATGTPSGAVPEVGAVEQPVVEIDVEAPAVAVRGAFGTAGPRQAAAAPGSGTG
jgi:hypothetical protein